MEESIPETALGCRRSSLLPLAGSVKTSHLCSAAGWMTGPKLRYFGRRYGYAMLKLLKRVIHLPVFEDIGILQGCYLIE